MCTCLLDVVHVVCLVLCVVCVILLYCVCLLCLRAGLDCADRVVRLCLLIVQTVWADCAGVQQCATD